MPLVPLPTAPAETHHWQTPHSELWAWSPTEGMLATRARGRFDVDLVQKAIQCFEELGVSTRHVDAFHDWEGVEAYTPEARLLYTEWSKERRARITGSVHILLASKLLAMGVAVANVVLKNTLNSYMTRASFERERARYASLPLPERVPR
ncbi:MAG: hypothetical protein AB2A00_06055 [Myxococcota bacterium]